MKLAKFVSSALLLSALAVLFVGSGRPNVGSIEPLALAGGSDTGGPTDSPIDPDTTFAGGSDSGRPDTDGDSSGGPSSGGPDSGVGFLGGSDSGPPNAPIDPPHRLAHGGESVGPNLA